MKTIYRNAAIYTVNENQPWAEELEVTDKVITYVGPARESAQEIANSSAETEIIDCGGRFLMPAFIDSHCHPTWIASSSWHNILPLYDNVEDLLAYVKAFAQEHPKEEIPFLYFDYYATELFDESGPRREMLDEIVSDRPIVIQDFSEHMSWMNSRMLELMEIDKYTPDIDDLHVYVRDPDGTPTGWVKELAWIFSGDVKKMYEKIGWYPPDSKSRSGQDKILREMSDYGYMGMFSGFMDGEEDIKGIHETDAAGELHAYYDFSYRCDHLEELPEAIAEAKRLSEKYTSGHVKLNTIKLFMDGTMAMGTTGMLEPINVDEGLSELGVTALDDEELEQYFRICNDAGMDVHIHTLGDRTFRMICDAVERIQEDIGNRWQIQVTIAHCCLVHPDDMNRPAQLGIALNMTPHWNGGMYGESSLDVLGRKRWEYQSFFTRMIDAGAQYAFSTDTTSYYEFNRSDPFLGIQVGATRVDPQYPLDPAKYPGSMMPLEEARIPVEQLLEGFTLGGAKQMHWEDKIGSLEAGKMANFNVLSQNLLEIPENEIMNTEILMSVFEGEIIRNGLENGDSEQNPSAAGKKE